MCARFSPQQVSHAVERGCGCARARESAVKSSIAQSTAACTGPAFGGGPARRQPVPPQGAEARAFTGQRTMNTRGTRPGLSPTFYRWAEPSLTVQPLGTGRPLVISAVYRGPDFPRACSSSPDTDGVLQPRKSMTMFDLLAMEPAKAAPIPERNQRLIVEPFTLIPGARHGGDLFGGRPRHVRQPPVRARVASHRQPLETAKESLSQRDFLNGSAYGFV